VLEPDQIRAAFQTRFGRPCQVVARAPGRVNLIGDHTDYNDGFVLPVATQHSTWVALAAADPTQPHPPSAAPAPVRVHSNNLRETCAWPIAHWSDQPRPSWTSYVAGVAALLRDQDAGLDAFDALIDSDVPIGAGLSSSAALSCAVALAVTTRNGTTLSANELAHLCRRAEHDFAKVPCGLMDQFASLASKQGTALLLDCRSLEYEHVPVSLGEHTFLIVDSGVRRELAASAYAERQQQCAAALADLQRSRPPPRSLRDVDQDQLRAAAARMAAVTAARTRHVLSENQRTLAAAAALRRGDLPEFGRLMTDSHQSLRDDYEVSCPELDLLVDILSSVPGVLGARMTGAGFGGSIVALACTDALSPIETLLKERYNTRQRQARLFIIQPGAGASIEYP
jgi:galactokinase